MSLHNTELSRGALMTLADRLDLDLGRVGIKPAARFLSEIAATKIEDAYRLSRSIKSDD